MNQSTCGRQAYQSTSGQTGVLTNYHIIILSH